MVDGTFLSAVQRHADRTASHESWNDGLWNVPPGRVSVRELHPAVPQHQLVSAAGINVQEQSYYLITCRVRGIREIDC